MILRRNDTMPENSVQPNRERHKKEWPYKFEAKIVTNGNDLENTTHGTPQCTLGVDACQTQWTTTVKYRLDGKYKELVKLRLSRCAGYPSTSLTMQELIGHMGMQVSHE